MELEPSPVPQRLTRMTVEIMRPVPVGPLTVTVQTVRPGRRVAMLEASGSVEGVECLRARGWKIELPSKPGPVLAFPGPIPPLPKSGVETAWPGAYVDGYMGAIEWRPTSGSLNEPGPAEVWARPRLPLLEGEPTSAFCRVAILADSGSGVGLSVDLAKVFAINVDLTLTLWRELPGEWIFMSARMASAPTGAGIAETALGDADGIAGLALQTLLIAGR